MLTACQNDYYRILYERKIKTCFEMFALTDKNFWNEIDSLMIRELSGFEQWWSLLTVDSGLGSITHGGDVVGLWVVSSLSSLLWDD